MKCLSICQPFAELIVQGKKTIELRKWNTKFRGEFLVHAAKNIQDKGEKSCIAFFSLEMSSEQLVNRLIASEAELSANKLRKGDLADHEMVQLHEKIKHLSEAPIYIDDTP